MFFSCVFLPEHSAFVCLILFFGPSGRKQVCDFGSVVTQTYDNPFFERACVCVCVCVCAEMCMVCVVCVVCVSRGHHYLHLQVANREINHKGLPVITEHAQVLFYKRKEGWRGVGDLHAAKRLQDYIIIF